MTFTCEIVLDIKIFTSPYMYLYYTLHILYTYQNQFKLDLIFHLKCTHRNYTFTFWLLYKNNWSLFESWNFQGFWVTFNYRCRSDHRFPKLSRRKSLGQSLVVKRLCSTTDEKSWARWIFYLRRWDIFRHEWSVGDTWEIYEMTW